MRYSIEHTPIAPITISMDMVDQMYEGRGDCCRCGCGGEYYNTENNHRKIQKALEKMASGKYLVSSIDNYIYEIELDKWNTGRTRVQTIYLKQP